MKTKTLNLLVIRTSALGDVAMCIPVIYPLAQQYPDIQIKVLTQPAFIRLFINHPVNISFIVADWKRKHRGIRGIIRLIQELNRNKIHYVADFHNVFRSWLIDFYFLLQGTPVSMIDKQRKSRKALTRLKNKRVETQKNYVLRYADVLRRLHFPVRLDFSSLLSPNGTMKDRIPLLLPAQKILIGIAPFARYPTKTYPLSLMEQVISKLLRKGYHLFLFGSGSEEQKILKDWERKYASCIALPGVLTLQEELILMGQLHVMLTMDSANMHLASLVHTPVVSLWGSTTPQCGFLGWKQNKEDAICLQLPCQPCSVSGRKTCPLKHFACMNGILPERICEQIEKHIIS